MHDYVRVINFYIIIIIITIIMCCSLPSVVALQALFIYLFTYLFIMKIVQKYTIKSNYFACLLGCRKDDAYYESLAVKAKAAGGGDDISDTSDADPAQLLQELVRPHSILLLDVAHYIVFRKTRNQWRHLTDVSKRRL